jgi:hypothetical protein
MSALRWAAVPVIAGALTGSVAVAAANEPPPAPTPTPTPTPTTPVASPDPSATPEPAESPTPEPTPDPPATGTVVYLTTVTTTTTTTNVNAPITVVAAPITTTLNNKTAPAARERFVMYLTGCGRPGQSAQGRVRYQRVRLGSNATLVVKVNGKPVATLRVPANARRGGQMLRLRLAPNGRLTIRRPSGRILAVQGCTPA